MAKKLIHYYQPKALGLNPHSEETKDYKATSISVTASTASSSTASSSTPTTTATSEWTDIPIQVWNHFALGLRLGKSQSNLTFEDIPI